MLLFALLEMCEQHGECVYIVCCVSRGKGIEPESCIGRVWSSLRSWLGLVAGLGRDTHKPGTMLGHQAQGPGGGRASVSGIITQTSEYAASTGANYFIGP